MTSEDARECAGALALTSITLAAAGEPLGAALFRGLADAAQQQVAELEAAVAEALAAERERLLVIVARVAADLDADWLALDGGPSTFGIKEWLAAGFAGVTG